MANTILDKLGKLPKLGCILHLGAGSGLEVPVLLATTARKIALVEPNPALLPALTKAAQDERCAVLPLAVAPVEGQAPLRRFNFPKLSSLKAPSAALTELFPGLKEVAGAHVDTCPLDAVLSQAGGDRSSRDVLIIDAPGMEGEILDMALALENDARFAYIVLRGAAQALYEGGRPFAALSEALVAAGYRLEKSANADPDFPEGLFRLDPLVQKVRQLEAALKKSTAAHEKAEEAARERRSEVEALKRALAERSDALSKAQTQIIELEGQLSALAVRQQKTEQEFIRAEAQMQLLREFMEFDRRRSVPTSLPAPEAKPARRSRAKKG